MDLDFQALGIAFATGWFANWSYGQWHNWYLRRKRAKGAYITVSHSSGGIDFEGRTETRNLSTTYLYGDVEYQISVKMETGKTKKEVKIPPYRKMS